MLSLSYRNLDGSVHSFDVWEVPEVPVYKDATGNLHRVIDGTVYTLFAGRWLKLGMFVEVEKV